MENPQAIAPTLNGHWPPEASVLLAPVGLGNHSLLPRGFFSPTYFEFPLSKLREGAPGTFQEQDKPVTTMPTDSASFRYGGREWPNAARPPQRPRAAARGPGPGLRPLWAGAAGADLRGDFGWLVAAHAPPLLSPRPAGAAREAVPASGRSLVAPPRGRRPEVRGGLLVQTGHKLERGGRSSRLG